MASKSKTVKSAETISLASATSVNTLGATNNAAGQPTVLTTSDGKILLGNGKILIKK